MRLVFAGTPGTAVPVLDALLASRHEVDRVIHDLHAVAADRRTVLSLPRVVQAWGYRDGAAPT